MTVRDVCADLVHHPLRRVIHRWNWKGATLSAILRGSIFFAANVADGLGVALRATLVDAVFRVPLVGAYAAITQAFRCAEPAWAASLAVMALLPATAHAFEFLVHWTAGTPELGTSMLASIAFNYTYGLLIGRFRTTRTAGPILAAGVAGNLLMLVAFKYADFLVQEISV